MAAATDVPETLLEAMLAVQAEAETLPKDRSVTVKTKQGGEYTYSYTPLDTIVEKTQPLLTKNGLVWSAKPSHHPAYGPSLKYKLSHVSGGCEEGEMPLMLNEEDGQVAQAMGSAITYMRRYAFCAVLNIVAEMDDDGALATGSGGGRGGTVPASDKQKKFLRTLITQKNLTVGSLRVLFERTGVVVAAGTTLPAIVDGLTKGQCSGLIEAIKDGPIPTGGSDVPSDPGDFTREPVEDGPPVPFDVSVAS